MRSFIPFYYSPPSFQSPQEFSSLPVLLTLHESEGWSIEFANWAFQHVYIKYWKPVGVTCTTDPDVPGNLLEALGVTHRPGDSTNHRRNHNHDSVQNNSQKQRQGRQQHRQQRPTIDQRFFSVGRLDKDSSGLLLLTSDGRVPNAVLRKEYKQPKLYRVRVQQPLIQDNDLDQLRRGVVITTDTVRRGRHQPLTARTLPCRIQRLNARTVQVELTEGRNRQIRVMFAALGYTVDRLHRVCFLGLDLSGLQGPGDWDVLNPSEKHLLDAAVERAQANDDKSQNNLAEKKP